MKGYKVFNKDLKCRNYQFEVGNTYIQDGEPELCANGFHFHENPKDLFNYYDFITENRVCEVECENVVTGDDKSVCQKITIIRELTWAEIYDLINIGKNNTGMLNTGDWNTGDRNTGDFNSTNYSSGLFNSKEQLVPLFNGAAHVLMSDFRTTENYNALFCAPFLLTEWIYESKMSDEEKQSHPNFYVQQGYLKVRTYKEACELWWQNTPEKQRKLIQEIPGFNKDIFAEITGINL